MDLVREYDFSPFLLGVGKQAEDGRVKEGAFLFIKFNGKVVNTGKVLSGLTTKKRCAPLETPESVDTKREEDNLGRLNL